ncbi:MAG: NUDIX hydrolase [Bacteroidales bacterium]|nr:NUDIX hydrolase [Bacteroidales bacterium]
MSIEKEPAHWLAIAKQINSIAQSGLAFTKDKFDKERYEQLLDLSINIINKITEIDNSKLQFVFNRDVGYQTPKVGVRAVVIKDSKILLVKEKMDGKWTLPGGYADTGMTPSEIVVNEVKEESGFDVEATRILGFIDYNKHQQRPFPFDIYQLFMQCEIIGGAAIPGLETSQVAFFDIDELPELSERRVTRGQLVQMYQMAVSEHIQPVFD